MRAYQALNRQTPWRTLVHGARLRSTDSLEQLAADASRGELDWPGLLSAVESCGPEERFAEWDIPRALCACLLASVLDPSQRHFACVTRLLGSTIDRSELWSRAAAQALRLAIHIATLMRDRSLCEQLLEWRNAESEVVWASRTDFMRPTTLSAWQAGKKRDAERVQRWWAEFNAPFTAHGLAPFDIDLDRIAEPEGLFTRISATRIDSLPRSEADPLVTVIVPTYNPDAGFLNTIASLTRQTWTNLEILIVDDASSSGETHLAAAESSDARVRVIRQPANGGAYRARNTGLRSATGEFIAFLDADDLSHPQRIEKQLRPLLDDPDLVATLSRSQRVLRDGSITFFGYLPLRVNASSLLFRRAPVLERLGQFDDVRKGADSEFTERMIQAFGRSALVELSLPLSLVQLTVGSLSRSDFRPHWMSGNRVAYLRQFRAAHQRIRSSEFPNWRLGPARPAIAWATPGMRRLPPIDRLSYAVLSDWNPNLEYPRDGLQRLRELAPDPSGPIGLLAGVRPRFSTMERAPVRPELADAVERQEVRWTNWLDATSIDTLIIDNPEFLLALPSAADIGITVGALRIVLDETIRRVDDPRLPPLSWCEERAAAAFGAPVSWMASPELAPYLRQQGRDAHVLAMRRRALPALPARPRIGVVLPARADGCSWKLHALGAHLPDPETADVLLYDEFRTLSDEQVASTGLRVVRGDAQGREAFLETVDVLVPDLFGERLLATESWVRRCGSQAVLVVLPDASETHQRSVEFRYPIYGSRDLLTALATVPGFLERWPEMRSENAETRAKTLSETHRYRYVVMGLPDETARAVHRISSIDPQADIVHAGSGELGSLIRSEAFRDLSASSRLLVIPRGASISPALISRFRSSMEEHDVVLFGTVSRDRPEGGEGDGASVLIGPETPACDVLGTCDPVSVRADVLAAAAHRTPHVSGAVQTRAALLAVSGAFRLVELGDLEVGSSARAASTTDRAHDGTARALEQWADVLTGLAGGTGAYLGRVCIADAIVPLLTSGEITEAEAAPDARARTRTALRRVLAVISDDVLWGFEALDPRARFELLMLKHKGTARPQLLEDDGEPRVFVFDLEVERAGRVPMIIDEVTVRSGVLRLTGRHPVVFDYAPFVPVLEAGGVQYPLEPLGEGESESNGGGAEISEAVPDRPGLLAQPRAFTIDVPAESLRGEAAFRLVDGTRSSWPLPLECSALSEVDSERAPASRMLAGGWHFTVGSHALRIVRPASFLRARRSLPGRESEE